MAHRSIRLAAAHQAASRREMPAEDNLPAAVAPHAGRREGSVADRALDYLGRRPLKLVRSVHGTTFYHMGRLPPIPPAVHQLRIEKREGGEGTRVWIDDLDGLLGLVEMRVVEIHPWGAKIDDIEHPDMLVSSHSLGT